MLGAEMAYDRTDTFVPDHHAPWVAMVTLTILADNRVAASSPRGLHGEWGFAARVGDVLFDTGYGGVVPENAARLGHPLDAEAVVLSHGHDDHTRGLDAALAHLDDPTVYCHPDVWRPRYRAPEDGGAHIGCPYTRAAVADRATVVEHEAPVEVADGVHALGEIPRPHPDAAVGVVEDTDGRRPDPVPDDQALAVETADGIAVVLGCGHAGLRNTVEYAETVTGGTVRTVVGGTHLVARDEEEVHELVDWLDGRLDRFGAAHCTGSTARRILAERLPDAFQSVGVGTEFEL
jgi:7,8-dihydropterin-6-yl-methyl-4-(beta-D-ribofuranosyl)aminobenzene 5'-phosphate synthase